MSNNHKEDAKRIAKNTLFLYIRSLIVMCISIYTSRVVLKELGVEDYGIYNVVGGVVAMFSMFSATFVSASQRFLSFSIGKSNLHESRKVFTISLNVHIIIALVIAILVELIGVWYLNTKLNVPSDRLFAANWVLQFSLLSFMCNLISIPYNALIISKEKMDVFAYVSIYEVSMKLIVVYLLSIAGYDKLIVYALLILMVSVSVRMFYGIYCNRKFQEANRIKVNDRELYKNFLSISGWNFLGSSSTILVLGGINLILNYFGGVVVNAAKGVASQIQTAITTLVNNFQTSLYPQIIKAYATNEYKYLLALISSGSRLSFFLTLFLIMPFLWTTTDILNVWLDTPPTYSTGFVRLICLYILLEPISSILDKVIIATGKIKKVQVITTIVTLFDLPLSVLVLYIGFEPYCVYLVYIIIRIINIGIRIYCAHNVFTLVNYSFYCIDIFLPLLKVVVLSLVPTTFYYKFVYNHTFLGWISFVFVMEISLVFMIYLYGIKFEEREKIINILKNKFKKHEGV